MKLLEQHLNDLIATDTRPPELRDLHQKHTGHKRSTIHSVKIITPPEPTAGATIKAITEGVVANAVSTAWGTPTTGPITSAMIAQGQRSDCYLLASANSIIRFNPTFFDDIIVFLADGKSAVVQYWHLNQVVQITCTLEVSTAFNNPGDSDIRIELLEKTYCLLRSGVADYAKEDMGSGTEAFAALGLTTAVVASSPQALATAINAGKPVVILTPPLATMLIASHVYSAYDVPADMQSITARNPWYGAVNCVISIATLANKYEVTACYSGTFNPGRLSRSFVTEAAYVPKSVLDSPPTVVIPVSPPKENTVDPITILANDPRIIANYQNGGFIEGGEVLFGAGTTLTIPSPAAGTFTLSVDAECGSSVPGNVLTLTKNSGGISTVIGKVTATPTRQSIVVGSVSLAAGDTITATGNPWGTLLHSITLAPSGVVVPTPTPPTIVSVAQVVTYTDGTTKTVTLS